MTSLLSTTTLLCALAVLVGACVQGASGIGFALFAAPLVALLDPELVPGPMLVLGGAISLLAALRERHHIDYRSAAIAFSGRVPGSLVAGLVIGLMPQSAFAMMFAFLTLAAIALSLWGPRIRATPFMLATAGLASGFMGTVTSVGTPPMGLVMQNMEPPRLRATIGLFLIGGSTVSLVVLGVVGRFGLIDLQRSFLLIPPMFLGFWLSSSIKQHIQPVMIRHIVLTVCALSALMLLLQHH